MKQKEIDQAIEEIKSKIRSLDINCLWEIRQDDVTSHKTVWYKIEGGWAQHAVLPDTLDAPEEICEWSYILSCLEDLEYKFKPKQDTGYTVIEP